MNALDENTGYESATYLADLTVHYMECVPKLRQQVTIWLNGRGVAYAIALNYHNDINEIGVEAAYNKLLTQLTELLSGDAIKINHTLTYMKSLSQMLRFHIEPVVNNSGIYMKDVKLAYIEEVEIDEWNTGTLHLRLNYPSRYHINANGRTYGT